MIPELIIPRDGFEPVVCKAVGRPRLTDFGKDWLGREIRSRRPCLLARTLLPRAAGGSGQASSWLEQTFLNHATGEDNASWANLAPTYLALCTVVPTSSSTGSTITEAGYTGYLRTSTPNTSWSAATGTAPATATNSAVITAGACTSGTATLIAMAMCTASTLGNVIFWMSCASTVISITQTPPTVNASGITLSQT
jgi:hypothetical protein